MILEFSIVNKDNKIINEDKKCWGWGVYVCE